MLINPQAPAVAVRCLDASTGRIKPLRLLILWSWKTSNTDMFTLWTYSLFCIVSLPVSKRPMLRKTSPGMGALPEMCIYTPKGTCWVKNALWNNALWLLSLMGWCLLWKMKNVKMQTPLSYFYLGHLNQNTHSHANGKRSTSPSVFLSIF